MVLRRSATIYTMNRSTLNPLSSTDVPWVMDHPYSERVERIEARKLRVFWRIFDIFRQLRLNLMVLEVRKCILSSSSTSGYNWFSILIEF
ncbi:hypothetical protein RchiOBHm_Chr4g0426471 [Rosa chinensis]|uniref:Uncharacterized protein n=1 Tax=Rosa chinensis TaxID=74649 RepID=A0A2P6QZD9_ROSCH|nr:hypothetical protein RchiOBHm_Chr4g0426471 [Rosa chinensis]